MVFTRVSRETPRNRGNTAGESARGGADAEEEDDVTRRGVCRDADSTYGCFSV